MTPFIPVTASGGSGTYSYALYNAANTAPAQLPSPMTFNTSTGAVSGTPGGTSPATTYTVRVTDTSPTPATATNTFSF
ncbi:putative Ig domain-containing protein, partial [Acinetobacter baumannii]